MADRHPPFHFSRFLRVAAVGEFMSISEPSWKMMSRVLRTGPVRLALDIIFPDGYFAD